MKKTTRTIIISGVALLAIGATAAKLAANKNVVENKVYIKDSASRVLVRTHTVASEPFNLSNRYVGTFQPIREVVVGAQTQGQVKSVGIQEGSRVGAGSLIAQVDNDLYQAQLYSAQASYENAQSTLRRYQNAAVGDGVSEMEIDRHKMELKSADAQVKQLRKQIAMSRITAPFSGIVTGKMVELGATVSPGTQLAKISDLSSLKLEIFVPEKELANFREGAQIEVTSDVYPGTAFKGRVELVSAAADAAHQFVVKIQVPNSSENLLKAGMYGTVQASVENNAALTIPRSALLGSAKQPQVFVVSNGAAQLRNVKTGGGNDAVIEITEGIQSGDVVVTSGQVNLANGTKVEISK